MEIKCLSFKIFRKINNKMAIFIYFFENNYNLNIIIHEICVVLVSASLIKKKNKLNYGIFIVFEGTSYMKPYIYNIKSYTFICYYCIFNTIVYICSCFIRNQKELEWLYMSSNRITNLDGELPIDNDKLMVLDVSKNRLTHLPPELNSLRALRYFYCTYNQLTGLNKTVSKSKKLVWLELTGNKIQEVACAVYVKLLTEIGWRE